MNNLETVFVDADDFCQRFLPTWKKHFISSGLKQRNKPSHLCTSNKWSQSKHSTRTELVAGGAMPCGNGMPF